MESSAGQLQEIGRENSMENMLVCSKQNQQERKARPQQEEALKCPRCDSMNTKFCYYNNYSLSQPRYFCKSCRRYWTKGGTLRNVPVGGGCRKNKRSSSSSSFSNSKKTQFENPNSNPLLSSLPPLTYDSNDLAFARLQKQSNGQLGFDYDFDSILGNPHFDILGNPNVGSQSYGFYGNLGEIEGCGSNQMMLPNHEDNLSRVSGTTATTQAVRVTTMKQEMCDFGREDVDQSKILFGFPWNGGIGDFDFGRETSSWNNIHGIASSSWHGVLNTPLM